MTYPIGTPGTPWGPAERLAWREAQRWQRSYRDEVLVPAEALAEHYDIEPYGTLPYPSGPYPLVGLRSKAWQPGRPKVLVTGGVHGYETSGVQGALRFAAEAGDLLGRVDLAIAPCVSPWGYEHIQRWNPDAIDPNRSFVPDSPAPECAALMAWVATLGRFDLHIDLHETTDSDDGEFRPARAARDGGVQTVFGIPDGFYLVGPADRPALPFQRAIRDAVAAVTHIADADADGCLIGVPVNEPGIIVYDADGLGLCMGLTDAPLATTTEVYPDSPRTDPEACIRAQVVAVRAGIIHLLSVK